MRSIPSSQCNLVILRDQTVTLRTTENEDEAKFVVVHSTTQPDEYQPQEKRTQDLSPIRYFMVTADRVRCLLGSPIHTTWVSLTRQVFHEQVTPPSEWLHLFSLQSSAAIDTLRNSSFEGVCSHSLDVQVPGDFNLN